MVKINEWIHQILTSEHVLSFSIEDTLRGSWRRRCPSLLVGTLLVHFINGSTQRERKIMSKLYLKISSDVLQRTTTVILLQGFNVCIMVYLTCLALYTILQRWFIVHIMVYFTCLSLYTILLGWFIVYIIVYLTCLSLYTILLGWFIVYIMVYLTCLTLYTILLGWFIVYIMVYLTCLNSLMQARPKNQNED